MDSKVENKLEKFFKQYLQKSFSKDAVILDAKEQPKSVYLLTEGVVKVVMPFYEGQELTLNLFKSRSLFPLGPALNKSSNEYRYEAMTDCKVWVAPADVVLKFIEDNSDVMKDLLRRIYRGLDGYMSVLAQQMTGTAKSKIVTQLVILNRRFGSSLNMTHTDLADLTGLSRETVTRELDRLSESGLLTLGKSHINVLNSKKLETLID